jgi:GxxExxY protein
MTHEEFVVGEPLRSFEALPAETERIGRVTLDAAFKVHITLGPGLLESVYELCLVHELRQRGLQVESQVPFPVVYDNIIMESGLRLDIVVENQLIVELKAVEAMNPVFEAQLLTYLKITGFRLGLLINFNVPLLKNGIKRMVQ